MAKHVIFLIHGMGEFADGWSKSVQGQITSLFSTYKIAQDFPFEQFFRFEEIFYNDRFDGLRKRWRTDSNAVLAQFKKAGVDRGITTALAKAGGAPSAENFLGTHVLDIGLYKLPSVAEAIRSQVAKRILDSLLADPTTDRPKWSMIAHSLGTAVAHDALHALFTTKFDGRTLAGTTKANVLMMVANVSRVLEETSVDVYRSVVRPGAQPADGVCHAFVNAKHEWDPFPAVKEFRPLDDWPDVQTRKENRYAPVTINAFQSKNIHALSHYLSNPKVHVAFFRRLFQFDGAISDDELAQASARYEASTPFGEFEALQKELKKLQTSGEDASVPELIKAALAFFETIKKF